MNEIFYKYHGLGNDFVLIDRRFGGVDIDSTTTQRLCDRRRGIGADGILVILPGRGGLARMVVHNADGSVPEMCGNGLRCAVKYLLDHSTSKLNRVVIDTDAGPLVCEATYSDQEVDTVEVGMGRPLLIAPNLPSHRTGQPFVDAVLSGHSPLRGTAVSIGNPHLVLFDVPGDPDRIGPSLEHHPDFPERTNVEFVERFQGLLKVVVWERGVGFTEACGTGACAAVVAAVIEKRIEPDQWIAVALPGGNLQIRVDHQLSSVQMKGPATFVFQTHVSSSLTG